MTDRQTDRHSCRSRAVENVISTPIISLFLSHKDANFISQECPSATPKNPIFITVSSHHLSNKKNKTLLISLFFSFPHPTPNPNRIMWASLGCLSLYWSEFHRENRKPRTFPLPSLPLPFPPPFYYILTILFLIKKDLSFYLSCLITSSHLPSPPFSLSYRLVFFRLPSISSLLMKKAKGVATASAAAMESSPPIAYEDTKIRFKHQTLLQDFEELYKEIEIKKKRLQMMRKKKMLLSGEVRFLRGRYKYLTQNQSLNPVPQRNVVLPQSVANRGKNGRKERGYNGNDAILRSPVPRFDLNQQTKIYNRKELTQQSPSPVFDLNQKLKTYIGKEAGSRNSSSIPDLNHKERIYTGKEATVQNNSPIFDLNQISREEEEFEANGGAVRIEELKMIPVRVGSDEQAHNDMKLSACRNVGTGSSRAGKRKITWQDQVALRV